MELLKKKQKKKQEQDKLNFESIQENEKLYVRNNTTIESILVSDSSDITKVNEQMLMAAIAVFTTFIVKYILLILKIKLSI